MRQIYAGENRLKWEDRDFNLDDVQSFFLHCNHLRDWVLKLNKIGITKADIDDFIQKNLPLQICADLANSSKHCRLERKTWSGGEPHLSGITHQSSVYDGGLGVKSEFKIWMDSEPFDALEIAEQCWSLWGEFIKRHKENYG